MKTLYLFNKGLSIDKIAAQRSIKESTVWAHLAKLIEYNKLSIFRVIPKEKANDIRDNICFANDSLKSIKQKINDDSITYDDIACVLSWVKSRQRNKKKF